MTAPGTLFSPPSGAIAVPATASRSRYWDGGFHLRAAAGSQAPSVARVASRSPYRSEPPGQAAVAGSPAIAAPARGAVSSPATAAAEPGRPHETDFRLEC